MQKKFFDYIEMAKQITIFSDNQKLARYLSIPANQISRWKSNQGSVAPADCVLLAELLGIETAEIAFVLKAEKEPEFHNHWLSVASSYARPVNPPAKYRKP